ncbi:NAD(P)-dependent oxidoreductase [Dactylosporangium sp. NPDC000555]|uniref:NAD-dependent epimerase/dehydratase family protein n=1 Tax=Dactylosporangium sp. NPDC000555 TaxID=3154260 RepID=UPI00331B9391
MTILITGATGNVGARLLPRLVAAGHDCRALIRPGKADALPAGVTPVEGDILEPDTLPAAVEGVSTVVHLAALLRSPDAEAIQRINVEGTRNLLAATRTHAPDARFVLASTSLVYPDDLPRPGREDDDLAPVAPYPASKILAEREVQASGLTWSVLRLGFVYGDGDQHLQNAPRLFGLWNWHPAHALHLVHQRDIATAVLLALTGATDGHVVNIVDDAPLTAYEIAALVDQPIEPSAAPLANPWGGRLDGATARALGFRATVPTVHHALRENLL